MTQIAWTDERVELLRQLWSRGLSSSQIAAEMGAPSRNSIIGKIHRLGLSEKRGSRMAMDEVNRRRRERRRERAAEAAERRSASGWAGWREKQKLASARSPVDMEASMEERSKTACTILELAAGKCRWPLWGPEAREGLYCGGRALGSQPYCACHAMLSYAPLPQRGRPYTSRERAA